MAQRNSQRPIYDVPTEAVRNAARRYRRPMFPNVLNDPYFRSAEGTLENAAFLHRLSDYQSYSVAPIVAAVESDIERLESRQRALLRWSLFNVCVAVIAGVLFVKPLAWVALGLMLASAIICRRRTVAVMYELSETETFLSALRAWTLQFKLASSGSQAVNRAVA